MTARLEISRVMLLASLMVGHVAFSQVGKPPFYEALETLHTSNKLSERRKAASDLIKYQLPFDSLYKLLQQSVGMKVIPSGTIEWEYKIEGIKYLALVRLPEGYQPDRAHNLIVMLHGGVFMSKEDAARRWWQRDRFDYPENSIVLYPSSWPDSPWWTESQFKNIDYLVQRAKASFNIDPNNIHLMGISDGGTGLYYLANSNPTLWASYVPMIANLAGLKTLADKQVYVSNFSGKPFYALSTDLDHLFPPEAVRPYMELLKEAGIDLKYRSIPEEGHSLDWYPQYQDSIRVFMEKNERNPYPNHLYWETEFHNRYNRNHWVVINKLKSTSIDMTLEDVNNIPLVHYAAFPRDTISGRLRVRRNLNQVEIQSQGIQKLTLLLSPDQFDFEQPLSIHINGKLHFNAILKKDPKVLLDWFVRDRDRAMLYAAEVPLSVGRLIKE